MKINAPALGAGFRRTDRQGNYAVKYPQIVSVGTAEQVNDLPRIVGPHICHGNKDARNFQVGVDFPLDI